MKPADYVSVGPSQLVPERVQGYVTHVFPTEPWARVVANGVLHLVAQRTCDMMLPAPNVPDIQDRKTSAFFF